jgi:hypothetical protein
MGQESAYKLLGGDLHDFLLIIVAVIPPAERYGIVTHVNQPVVGDSDTVRIATQVIDNPLCIAKWRLTIDHPVYAVQFIEKLTEALFLIQIFHIAIEMEILLL